ncbi:MULTISPECIES: heavy metal translocating P-type ATPase [unclassified Minwuia]|jgi:P-type Cu2+ transporter|uniref:heavy metal translocating P-type ATPase n=1 Tax=unclassified Minwuia TaxID=2618799 RepID=UPI0024788044|nr:MULTISPECIES: heavy metal translocating P-type ATPase [unclassified Minwuia]
MSCCTSGAACAPAPRKTAPRSMEGNTLELIIPGVHCAGCISRIEGAVSGLPGVESARLNLSTRRLRVGLGAGAAGDDVIPTVEGLGYDCRTFSAAEAGSAAQDRQGRELLFALAVAGFAAGNVMLLSVSVWSGAEGATRDLFHWISALIALPAILFAGRPFFRSAWRAVKGRSLNMDVPISLAVLLAGGLSLDAAISGGEEAFFDAAVMLLFFLLVGRYLDHRVRARARDTVGQLLSLMASDVTLLVDGGQQRVPVETVNAGDMIRVAAGERAPVDGQIIEGQGDLDRSIVTGESMPVTLGPGDQVEAGTLVLTHPLTLRATAVGQHTFLAQVVRLMEEAESGRARYLRLADRAAQIYAPAVHLVALLTFIGWMLATGGDWGQSLWIAVSVLIITCPCALGLAVPAVQVVASGVLFGKGILIKDGTALERLAEARRVVLDKTGTLTSGKPHILRCDLPPSAMVLAQALAAHSRHPLAQAMLAGQGATSAPAPVLTAVTEHPGQGMSGTTDGRLVRLGSRAFAGPGNGVTVPSGMELWLSIDGVPQGHAVLADTLRDGAVETIAALQADGFAPLLISGDNATAVADTAQAAGIADWRAEQRPEDKIEAIQALVVDGQRPLMVGDGINDGPALAAAHVSMAPASASDLGRAAADIVFLSERLDAVTEAMRIARRARALIVQNFGLALAYNLVAVPVAVLGGASPLVAAIAMSSSSLVVTLNALRLRLPGLSLRRTGGAPKVVRESQEAPA